MKQIQRILLVIILFINLFFISNCNQLDTIDYSPKNTPTEFLSKQHWMEVSLADSSFILSQPSSSIFVYFLSFLYLYVGYKFWRDLQNQKSRYWWAMGFFLTGVAAILAGTSYQALGYELKCTGREFCRWTTWWEINYEILQNAGMNGFLAAAAYTSARGRFRNILLGYAILNTIIYSGLVLYGAIVPIQFLVSFEFLELSCLPAVVFFLISSAYGYFTQKDKMNFHLLMTWILLVAVMIAYVISLESDITSFFWKQGVWFTENDVLHVGLIFWVYYIFKTLPSRVMDIK